MKNERDVVADKKQEIVLKVLKITRCKSFS